MSMSAFVGTWQLVRFAVRRDWIRIVLWALILGYMPAGVAAAFVQLYPDEAARAQLVGTLITNPGLEALIGPVYSSSIGGLTAWRIGTIGAVLIGVMAMLSMVRHTRAEEETGRSELLGATVVGRLAPLAAAYAVTAGLGLVIGLAAAVGLMASGEPLAGSVAFGLSWLMAALVFGGVGAVASQLAEGARAARGMSGGVIGLAFLLRVAGDGAEGGSWVAWLSWVSPIGWSSRVQAFADERWWVPLLSFSLALFLAAAAVWLNTRRDIGSGIWVHRPGPAAAHPRLVGPLGLAWRIQRGSLAGWTVGMVLVGVVFGGLAESIGSLLVENPEMAAIFERMGGAQGLTDAFFSSVIGLIAYAAAAYAISAALVLRTEEESGRVDPVLSTSVPRWRWIGSHLLFAYFGPVLLMLVAAGGAGLVHGLVIGDVGGQVPTVLESAILQTPAVWIMAGVAVVVFGWRPRLSVFAWAMLVTALVLGLLGAVLQFPQWAIDLSPFTHVPQPPGAITAAPLIWLTAAALGATATGIWGALRRDIH